MKGAEGIKGGDSDAVVSATAHQARAGAFQT